MLFFLPSGSRLTLFFELHMPCLFSLMFSLLSTLYLHLVLNSTLPLFPFFFNPPISYLFYRFSRSCWTVPRYYFCLSFHPLPRFLCISKCFSYSYDSYNASSHNSIVLPHIFLPFYFCTLIISEFYHTNFQLI